MNLLTQSKMNAGFCSLSQFPKTRKKIREALDLKRISFPIYFTESDNPPIVEGKSYCWYRETKKGEVTTRTPPKYPGWKYRASTMLIKVGFVWFWENMDETEKMNYVLANLSER